MNSSESKQDYLERILMLEQYSDKIKAIQLAKSFNFSRASISIALKKLLDEGYVLIDSKQNISLTEEGRKIAEKVYERHQLLTKVFIYMGVDRKVAASDACKLEHDLSDETYDAIKKFFKDKVNNDI